MTSFDSNFTAAAQVEPTDGIGRWLDRHAPAMLLAAAAGAALGTALPVVLVAAASFALFWHANRRSLAELRPFGGYASWLTTLRLVLILAAAAAMTRIPAWVVLLAFAANVVLDAADGYVARCTGQVTAFGSVLDRETDALFVLAAYEYFFLTRGTGAWVLLPGLFPYLYRLLVRTLSDAPISEKRQLFAARLAGANFGILLVAIAAPPRLGTALIAASAALVALSFGAAIWKLYRNDHPVSE